MEKKISYITRGTCSRQIDITVEDGIVKDVAFYYGCAGNTAGIAKLVRGMKIEDVIARLKGTCCGSKPTSCPDQLARALETLL